MALPGFYNQVDQDIYTGGEHFIPQEQYRLGYTAPPSIANAPDTGITNTQVARPYIWPPQGGGGGGGGGGSGNKFGLNMDTLKTITSGKYVEKGGPGNMYGGTYVPTERQIAQTEGGIWKDINTNQNVYHANMPQIKGLAGTVMDFMSGKDKNRDIYEGTWTGAEWDDEFDPTVANRNLNTIQRWKAKKEFKAAQEKAAADKIAEQQAAVKASGADVGHYDPGAGGASHLTRGRDQGGLGLTQSQAQSVSQANKDAGYSSFSGLAEGGRIGYAYGTPDPEEPAENVFEFMQDQNIPMSEQVEAGPTEEQIAMVIDMDGKGIDMETISSITELGKETIMSILGVEMAQGGIARLL